MDVFAFVGVSGSGKSYRAQLVANQNNIECIIDDGLLIKGNKVLWGSSAKREDTKIASVKRAIFMDKEYAQEMKKQIDKNNVKSLLILGTSDDMIFKIVKALDLPDIKKIIRIEDIASSEEIKLASSIRKNEGKHVIPVPTFELKKDFNGYMLDPLKIFRKKDNKSNFSVDTSIIRPTYSYLGNYKISDFAIYNIVQRIIKENNKISKCTKFNIDSKDIGIILNMDIVVVYGNFIPDIVKNFQDVLRSKIEYYTGINVIFINVTVKSIEFNTLIN